MECIMIMPFAAKRKVVIFFCRKHQLRLDLLFKNN